MWTPLIIGHTRVPISSLLLWPWRSPTYHGLAAIFCHTSPTMVLPTTAAAKRLVLPTAPTYTSSCYRSAVHLLLGPLRPLALTQSAAHTLPSFVRWWHLPAVAARALSTCSGPIESIPATAYSILILPILTDCHSFLLSGVDPMAVSLLPLN
jgi:hypothetical protein